MIPPKRQKIQILLLALMIVLLMVLQIIQLMVLQKNLQKKP